MSEWGHVLFYYDYEREVDKEPVRIKGIVEKSYKNATPDWIIMHAFNGIRYFLEHEKRLFKYYMPGHDNGYKSELNRAFDVIFEGRRVDEGYDSLDCGDDHWGTCFASYTGSMKDGFQIRLGYRRNGKALSLQDIEDCYTKDWGGSGDAFFPEYLGEIRKFFDDHGATMIDSSEGFEIIENQVADYLAEEEKRRAEEEKKKAEQEKRWAFLPDYDSEKIEDMGFSARVYRMLRRNGIETVEQLLALSDDDLRKVKGLGQKGYEEVKAGLKAREEYQKEKDTK